MRPSGSGQYQPDQPATIRLPFLFALMVFVLLIGGAGATLLKLEIDNSPEVYLPPTLPSVVFDKQLRKVDFPQDQVLVVLFTGERLFERQFLNSLDKVVRQLERDRAVERVVAVTTADHISGTEGDFVVEPLVDVDLFDDFGEAGYRERVLADRFAPGITVSADGLALSLIIRPVELNGSLQRYGFVQSVKEVMHREGLDTDIAALGGQIALDVAELEAMYLDSIVFIPLTTIVGMLLIWFMFRRGLAVALALLSIATVVLVTVAIVAIWGRPYTLVASIIPPFMAALTTAVLIHLFSALSFVSSRGAHAHNRVEKAVSEVKKPVFYTCLTTSVGLFSLSVNPILPIQTFGIATGIAVLLLYPIMIWLLPPLIKRWDSGVWSNRAGGYQRVRRFVNHVVRFSIRRAGWVVSIFIALIVVAAPQISHVHAETDLYKFFKDDHPLNVSTRMISDRLSGVTTIEIVFDSPERGGLKNVTRLNELNRFQDWLERLPQVDRTFCMADVLEEMNWAFHGEQNEYRVIPENPLLMSQYLLIYSGNDLYELVNEDFSRTRLTVNLNVTGSSEIKKVVHLISAYLTENQVADLKWEIAGFGRLFADQEDLLVQGQVDSLYVVFVLVFTVLVLLMRSFGHALLCMVPNISPVFVIFVVMGMIGIWLDMATAMIAGVAVGVAVDDTIHLYFGYRRRLQGSGNRVFALVRAYSQVGGAIVVTTLVLVSQMVLLGASQFVPTIEFGLLTALGILTALLFDLLLLPALLVLMDKKAWRVN